MGRWSLHSAAAIAAPIPTPTPGSSTILSPPVPNPSQFNAAPGTVVSSAQYNSNNYGLWSQHFTLIQLLNGCSWIPGGAISAVTVTAPIAASVTSCTANTGTGATLTINLTHGDYLDTSSTPQSKAASITLTGGTLTAPNIISGTGTALVAGDIGGSNILRMGQGGTFGNVVTIKGGVLLQDATDASKQAQFSMSGISPSTTRTFTFPDVNGNVVTTGDTATVSNAMLANKTISGTALGGTLPTLTFGAHLTATDTAYNGAAAKTIASDASTANTPSTIVARDAAGAITVGGISNAGDLKTGNSATIGTVYLGTDFQKFLQRSGDTWTFGALSGNPITLSAGAYSGDGSALTGLNASNLITGTVALARLPFADPTNATNLASGTVSGARLPAYNSGGTQIAAHSVMDCTGSISAGATQTVTLTGSAAFASSNYFAALTTTQTAGGSTSNFYITTTLPGSIAIKNGTAGAAPVCYFLYGV
jgi:hypothetical protein